MMDDLIALGIEQRILLGRVQRPLELSDERIQ